jgi:hypothetical protein
MEMEDGVRTLTTVRAHMRTQPAISLPQKSVAESDIGIIGICTTLSATKMRATRLKTDARSKTTLSMNNTMKETTTIMVPSTISVTNTIPQKEDIMKARSKLSATTWKDCIGPLNFKSPGIEKYDGSTNPAEWLEVYQLAIETAGGDTYVMVKYLLVCPSSSARMWFLGLPTGLVCSLSQLCQLFTSNFQATCTHPGVNWDPTRVVQKKGESLREFIHYSCNKRNIIPEINDKSIIMFFKKVLRDLSLFCKLTMKNPWTSEEMLAITNKYALAEEVTLDTIEQKKEKESGHSDKPSSSKGHDKKRKPDLSVNNLERSCRNKEYRPSPGEFEGFLDQICIFHP